MFSFNIEKLAILFIIGCFALGCRTVKKEPRVVEQTITLYHATNAANTESILKDGLLLSKGGQGAAQGNAQFESASNRKIHLTEIYRVAMDYAHFLYCKKKVDPVILAIKMDESYYGKLRKDRDDDSAVVADTDIEPSRIKVISSNMQISDEDCTYLVRNTSQEVDETYQTILSNEILSRGKPTPFKDCEKKFGGKVFGPIKEYCVIPHYVHVLGNLMANGEKIEPFNNCEKEFEGIRFGTKGELCAVKEYYKVLKNQSSSGENPAPFRNCREKLKGKLFGPNKEFCCVTPSYTVLENVSNDGSQGPFLDCETTFHGVSFGPDNIYCATNSNAEGGAN